MKTETSFESQLWGVLAEERLTDLSQFHRRGFFDEVPLYSRISQVAFLKKGGAAKANRMLLAFGLKFLNALLAYDHPRWPFLAALTVWDDTDDGLIVPNVFVCSGEMRPLDDLLVLHQPAGAFAKMMMKLLMRVDRAGEFLALEDNVTLSEAARVFIGRTAIPDGEWMVTIDRFEEGAPLSPPHRS